MPSPLDSIPTKRRSPLDAIPAKRRSPLDAIPTAPKATIPAEDKDALAAAGRDLGRERQAATDAYVAKKHPPKSRMRKNLEVLDPIMQVLPGPGALLRGNIAPVVASNRFAKTLPSPEETGGTVLGDVSNRPVVGAIADVAEIVGAGPRIGVTPADKYSPTVKAGATVAADLAKAVATGGTIAPATLTGRIALGAATGAGIHAGHAGAEDPTGTLSSAAMGGLGGAMAPATIKQAVGAVAADAVMTVADLVRQRPDVAARVAAGKQTPEDVQFLTVQGLLSAVPSVAGNVGGAVGAKRAGNRALTEGALRRGVGEQAELRPMIQAEQKTHGISDADIEEMLRSSVIDEQQQARADAMRPELLSAIEAEKNTQALTDEELDMLMRRAQAEESPLPRELSTPEELIARQLDRPIPAQHPDTLRREPFAPEILPALPEPAPRDPIADWINTGRRPLSPDFLGEPPVRPMSPPMDPQTGAPLTATPKGTLTKGGPSLRNRGRRGSTINPWSALVSGKGANIRTSIGDVLDDWLDRAATTRDTLAEKGKRAILDSRFIPAPLRRAAQFVAPNKMAGPEFARYQSILNGARQADSFTRVAFEDMVRPDFDSATAQQKRQMVDLLEDDSAPDFSLTEKQRAAIERYRLMIAPMQQRIIELGIVPEGLEEFIDTSIGEHARRFYRVHEDADVPFNIQRRNPEVWDEAVLEWSDVTGVDPLQADAELTRYLRDIPTRQKGAKAQPGGGKTVLASPFMARHLEDRPALRAILGEYTDPLQRMSKTLADMSNQVARGEFLNSIATAKDQTGTRFAVSQEEAALDPMRFRDWVEVPNERKYGAAAGKLMRPEHRDALMDGGGDTPAPLLGSLLRPFYISNTALSTGTTGANFVSGASLHSWLSDSWIGNPLNAGYYKKAAKALFDRTSPEAQELFKRGAASGMFLDEPIESAKSFPIRKIKEALDAGHSPLEVLRREALDFDKNPGVRHAIRFYNDIDLFYRFASVYKRLDKNLAKEMPYEAAITEAVKWTNKFHPDYSKVPTALKVFQKHPVAGPFLSYTFEMPRIFANAIQHNPIKAAGLMAGLGAVAESIGVDEKERALRDEVRPLLSDAEQADITLGWKHDGKYTQLPLGRIMPWAQFIAQARNPKFNQFFLSDPAMNAIITAVTGRDVRGVKQIPSDAGMLERIGIAGRQLALSTVPPLTPGAYEAKYLGQAFGDEVDPYGRRQSKTNALLGLTGVRPRDAEWDAMYLFRAKQLNAGMRDRKDLAERIIRNPGASDSDLSGAVGVLDSKLAELKEKRAELDKAERAARKLAPESFTSSSRKNLKEARESMDSMEKQMLRAIKDAKRKMSANNPERELVAAE